MDFHAGIGTKAEKTAIEQKYPNDKDVGDGFGNYSSDYINGNNKGLYTRVTQQQRLVCFHLQSFLLTVHPYTSGSLPP